MRKQHLSVNDIKEDDAWRTRLPARYRRVIMPIAWILYHRYGYQARSSLVYGPQDLGTASLVATGTAQVKSGVAVKISSSMRIRSAHHHGDEGFRVGPRRPHSSRAQQTLLVVGEASPGSTP
jgi:hypothetical protein